MTFRDNSIRCGDCGKAFVFGAGEHEFFSEGLANQPRRCPSCRAAKKMLRGGDGDYSYRSRSWR